MGIQLDFVILNKAKEVLYSPFRFVQINSLKK